MIPRRDFVPTLQVPARAVATFATSATFALAMACAGGTLGVQVQAQAPAAKSPPAAAPAPAAAVAPASGQPAAADYDPTVSRVPKSSARTDGVRTLLWRVKSKDGRNTLYLFGTIHVGKPSFYPFPATVETALTAASKIVVEADVTDQSDAAEIGRLVDFPKGDSIEKHISPELLVRLRAQLDKRKIAYANVATMRPVILGGMLPIVEYVKLGYDMASGLDMALITRAKAEKKTLLQLETPLEQVKLMTSMSTGLQEAFLDNSLLTIEQGRSADQVTGMVNAWQLGDPKLMLELADDAARGQRETERLNQILLWDRHPAMLEKIESYLASGDIHFVSLGSLHLVGPKGLVSLLAKRGYKIEQL